MNYQPTVFIVDDDPAVRDSLRWLLESMRLKVATFASAEDFLKFYTMHMVGCLILDVRMPGMSGLQLQQFLTKQKYSLPIIFITGHGDIPMAVRAMQAGAMYFLEKPFEDQVLLDYVHEALALDNDNQQSRIRLTMIQARIANLTEREREVMESGDRQPFQQGNCHHTGGQRQNGRISPQPHDGQNARHILDRTGEYGAGSGNFQRVAPYPSKACNSGMHEPQFVPAFKQRPMLATESNPCSAIALRIVFSPTLKHAHTVRPLSSLATAGLPANRLMRSVGCRVACANKLTSQSRAGKRSAVALMNRQLSNCPPVKRAAR